MDTVVDSEVEARTLRVVDSHLEEDNHQVEVHNYLLSLGEDHNLVDSTLDTLVVVVH